MGGLLDALALGAARIAGLILGVALGCLQRWSND